MLGGFLLEIINSILWAFVTILIIFCGLYFSKMLSFPQFNFKKIFISLKSSNNLAISPLKTLYLTLAGRIGVGSIAGVALAIYVGGPGTIFWMWIIAFISGSLAYSETLLGVKYKTFKKNQFYGGPSYYISKGLNNKFLAVIYSFVVIIAYLIGFIPIQANTISRSINMSFYVNRFLIGIILGIIVFFIIKGGIKKIIKITDKLVPFMTFVYVGMALFVIVINIDIFFDIIILIFKKAFSFSSFFTGFVSTMLIGVQRGIFSNEAGIGLGSIAASSSSNINGCRNGYIQVLGIYITTILVCTATAFMILIFDYNSILLNNPNGIEITSLAFHYHFGNFAKILLLLCIFLFSFSTILAGYYYLESSFSFLNSNFSLFFLNFIVPFSVFIGSILSPTIIWRFVDILVAVLAIINIYSIYKLRFELFNYHKKYDRI